jgi:PAS domain S-box-containing protein
MSLRRRIAIIIGAALLPLVVIQAGLEYRCEQQRRAEIAAEARHRAQSVSDEVRRIVEGVAHVLIALSPVPAVRGIIPGECDALLANAAAGLPYLKVIGAVAPNGAHGCLSRNFARTENIADRAYFAAALASESWVAGGVTVGKVSGRYGVEIAYAVREAGVVRAVLFASLDLEALSRELGRAFDRGPLSGEIVVADRNGTILTRLPDHREWVGRPLSAAVWELATRPEGSAEAEGLDGARRLLGFVPPGTGSPYFVAASMQTEAALAMARRGRPVSLGMAVIALAAALLAGFVIADRLISAPLRHLIGLVQAWKRGEWHRRPTVVGKATELAALGTAFDELAEAAAFRERRLRAAKERAEAAERDLRRSQEHLARAQELAAIGSWEFEVATGELYWSAETYRIFGVSPATFSPTMQAILEMIHPDDREHMREVMGRLIEIAKDAVPLEYRMVRPDGMVRVVRREIELVRAADGRPLRVVGTVHDITEQRAEEGKRRALEMQLIHAQRLDAIGTLAGGIAHDLNNTLVPIVALSKLSLARAAPGTLERENFDLIYQAGRRAKELVGQVLAFSRREAPEKRPVELGGLVTETLRLMRASLPSSIDLRWRMEETRPVEADSGQLHQVVVNLVTNAAQAIGREPGVIVVEVAMEPDEDEARPRVRMSVRDSGPGMSAQTRARIFEPFFTTRDVGEGTGLGLAIVHGIVTSHGGTIDVRSEMGEGAEFVMRLPACQPRPIPVPAHTEVQYAEADSRH